MKYIAAVVAVSLAFLPPAFCALASGQVDPAIARSLSQRFSSDERQFRAVSGRLNTLSMRGSFNRSYDNSIASGNIRQCVPLLDNLRSEIYALAYEKAAVDLNRLESLIRATDKIIDEDVSLSGPELARQSVLDPDLAPSETTPNLQGPALRAAIGGEITFAERVHARARIPGPFAGSAPSSGVNATPCSDAKDHLVSEELEMEGKLGYTSSSDFGGPNSFYSMARNELGLLHYKTAHDLASKAYVGGQKVLTICSTEFGNSSPPSIVVTSPTRSGNGKPYESTSTTGTVKKVSVPAAVAAGLLIEKTAPVYPPIAQAARVSGSVVLRVTISTSGSVEAITDVRGPAMLVQSAVNAVRTWHYKPYTLNGEPVEVETTVYLVFAPGK
jgi:TonB family protein